MKITFEQMRSVDDIANDFANAGTDVERAALLREMDAANAEIAALHLRAGHVNEYQSVAVRGTAWSRNVDAERVHMRMLAGQLDGERGK